MYIIGQRSNINGPTHHYIYITYDIFSLSRTHRIPRWHSCDGGERLTFTSFPRANGIDTFSCNNYVPQLIEEHIARKMTIKKSPKVFPDTHLPELQERVYTSDDRYYRSVRSCTFTYLNVLRVPIIESNYYLYQKKKKHVLCRKFRTHYFSRKYL